MVGGEWNSMQKSNSRNGSSEVPQMTSPATPRQNGSSEVPQRASPHTPKSTRGKKIGASESESASSKSTPTKTPIDRSTKVNERRSPRSPVTEKRRPIRVTELESQITQLQEELTKTKDQLVSSETWRRRNQQESEDAKAQLSAVTVKLEESQRHLMEFSAAEEARLQELCKISQDRDREWQSELEATQKQYSADSAALTTAMSEIYRLKQQLEVVSKSEAAQIKEYESVHSELLALKQEMDETVYAVEELKAQLKDSEKAETEARTMAHETQQQLEMAMATVESLRVDGLKLIESFQSNASELEESRAQVTFLEETVKKLQATQETIDNEGVTENPEKSMLELEVEQLRSALEAAEAKCQEDQVQSTMQIRSALQSAERVRLNSEMREAELELALQNAKAEILELKAGLTDKEREVQSISEMNKKLTADIERKDVNRTDSELEAKLTKTIVDVADLKASLLDKETELHAISKENELLKAEMVKREMEDRTSSEAAITDVELARAAEQDALMRLGCLIEEADKSTKRAARVEDQLEAAQVLNSEMEAELRRLRVQSDQWRKAAEAAAAALSPVNNGQFVERTYSLDTEYQPDAGKLMSSPFSNDLDDESKKKNNVMKRVSGLWKKTPK